MFIKKKTIINLSVIICLAIAVIYLQKPSNNQAIENHKKDSTRINRKFDPQQTTKITTSKNNESTIDRHPNHITYSKHAKCRMECRNFDESEVKEILADGEINYKKSNDRPNKCPTYALEGKTHDGQHARMVFSFCDNKDPVVVTVIDLDTDWECNCY